MNTTNSQIEKVKEEYWINRLNKDLSNVTCHRNSEEFIDSSKSIGSYSFALPNDTVQHIRTNFTKTDIAYYTFLASAFNVLISRYTLDEKPILVGTSEFLLNPNSCPKNLLHLLTPLQSKNTFKDVLNATKEAVLGAYKNQSHSILDLEEKLPNLPKNFGFIYESIQTSNDYLEDYDILFCVNQSNQVEVKYKHHICDEAFVLRMNTHFTNILNSVAYNLDCTVGSIPILSEKEIQILTEFNNTNADFPKQTTVHGLFEKQVGLLPETIALSHQEEELTYSALNAKANQLARHLLEQGLQEEDVVALHLIPSFEMLISIIGVLKAGGAYLPVDPELPSDRLKFILSDSKARFILSNSEFKSLDLSQEQILIDLSTTDFLDHHSIENVALSIDPNNLAYIIYTSGSTGKPKGCLISHQNVIQLIHNDRHDFNFNHKDTWILTHAYYFDYSVWEMYGALLYGAKLIVPTRAEVLDIGDFINLIIKHKVTVLNQTPIVFNFLVEAELKNEAHTLSDHLRYVFFGGDKLDLQKLIPWVALYPLDQIQLVNLYGITETTVISTSYSITNQDLHKVGVSPIGGPIPEATIYVLDDFLQRVPINVVGEMYIGGSGVGVGYLNQPELTSERFIDNPFKSGERLYKSGDLARWKETGILEYVGRKDFQIKIRGFRIEAGEIEHTLKGLDEINEALVLVKKDPHGVDFLCAYITLAIEDWSEKNVKEQLSNTLLSFMVPDAFVVLDKFPLSPSGKLDRKALPEPTMKIDNANEFVPAANKTEEILVGIWEDILDVERISVTSNFFHLGGHSLKGASLITQAEKVLNTRIKLKLLFEYPTIRSFAEQIKISESYGFESIPILDLQPHYAVSPAQKRLWLVDQIQESSIEYNMVFQSHFSESIDVAAFENAVDFLIMRHETLRTTFSSSGGVPIQIIHNEPLTKLEVRDLSAIPEASQSTNLAEIQVEMSLTAFDLEKGPLVKAILIKLNEDSWQLVFGLHHIITDGWSLDLLRSELIEIYRAYTKRADPTLQALPIQYKDYAAWQNDQLSGSSFEAHKQYWHQTLKGNITALRLPYDFETGIPAGLNKNQGASYQFQIDAQQLEGLKSLGATSNASLFMVLLSGFNVLLHKICDSNNILIGTPSAGRAHDDLKLINGFFLNTLILRNEIHSTDSFHEILLKVQQNVLSALDHQAYPFEELVDELNVPRNPDSFPITSVFFNMLNFGNAPVMESANFHHGHKKREDAVKFDLNIYAKEYKNGIQFTCVYKQDLFLASTIETIFDKYVDLMSLAIDQSTAPISTLITGKQLFQGLSTSKNDWFQSTSYASITDRFEEVAKLNPDKKAIWTPSQSYTYQQLSRASDHLAQLINDQVSGSSQVNIAICTDHSEEMVLAILAVLKAGHIYVPLDASYPKERLNDIVNETNPALFITIDSFSNFISKELTVSTPMIVLDAHHWNAKMDIAFVPIQSIAAEDTAYILYTSGSTGKPKGVAQTHKGVLHFISNYSSALQISAQDTLTGFSSINFDSFVNDLYGALLNGACYIPISLKDGWVLENLVNTLNAQHVTIWHSVPSVFRLFSHQLKESNQLKLASLRIIKMTGEATSNHDYSLFKDIAPKSCSFVVSYGSTESTLNTIQVITNDAEIYTNLITPGKVVPRTEMIILDKNENVAGILESGEIFVHSDFITPGYYLNTTLNEQSFLTIEEKRFYKTGDVGYFDSEEALHISGRKDNQIKIRGIRVETGEIEHHLLQYPGIKESLVIAYQDAEEQQALTAYLTTSQTIDLVELKAFLSQQIATHLIPTYFVELDSFQFTPNGKIDRNKLLKPSKEHLVQSLAYVAPTSKLEEDIHEIWKDVLKIDASSALKIGVMDSFFDLGGQSLKAIAFTARFATQFGIQIPLRIFFQSPTIRSISNYVASNQATRNQYEDILPVPTQDSYPLSSSQKRLYILNQFELNSTAYNLPSIMHIYGSIDIARFEHAFVQLIQRHESLRTNFKLENDEIIQIIHPEGSFELKTQTIKKDEISDSIGAFVQPFDLEKDALLKVQLLEISDSDVETNPHHLLLIDIHHIVADGQSLRIIKHDFIRLYNSNKTDVSSLPPLPIQFKDYAVWQNKLHVSEEGDRLKKYWLNQLEDVIPTLELPFDYPRPELQSFNGDRVRVHIGSKLTTSLLKLAQAENTTLFIVLLTAFKTLLHHYSGNKDIAVGSPISGRFDEKLEGLIGMFVNTLILRSKPTQNHTFSSYVQEVKKIAAAGYDHQLFSFEEIIEELNLERDLSRNPLFDTTFVLQEQFENEVTLDSDLRFENYRREIKTSKFDLSLIAVQNEDDIQLILEYCTDLFHASTMEKMLASLLQIIEQASESPSKKLADFDVISTQLREQLLNRYEKTNFTVTKTVEAQVSEIASRFPQDTSLSFEGKNISYERLDQTINYWAKVIENLGIKDSRIGLRLKKSPDIVYAIFAIWRSGNSYVPIDPDAPIKRMELIAQDADLKAIFTTSETSLPKGIDTNAIEVSMDIDSQAIHSLEHTSLSQSKLTSEAYTIYTSGSTGVPKGVSISHLALAHKLGIQNEFYAWNKDLTTLFGSNYTFDATILEIFPPLLLGGKLVIPTPGKLLDFKHLYDTIRSEKISVVHGTPSYLKAFMQSAEQLDKDNHPIEHFCIGGESLNSELVELIREDLPGAQINNQYGPTEVTVYAFAKKDVRKFTRNIVGQPLPNTPVYVLSEDKNLIPDGVVGEIYIGGSSVAIEYLNQPELSSKAFVSNPFIPNSNMYKTGDLGRWTATGELEFLGRRDHQYKIRGYRVELGEVESCIENHPSVSQTVAQVIQNASGDSELLAYYVLSKSNEKAVSPQDIRSYLSEQLPAYMIPSFLTELDHMPLNTSGKLDRKALPSPSFASHTTAGDLPPSTPFEVDLAAIWATVLGIETIGRNAHFLELGGHSLKAIALSSKISELLSLKFSVRQVFQTLILKDQAAYLEKQQASSDTQITILPAKAAALYPLSSAQRRMYLLHAMDEQSVAYNIPSYLHIKGHLDIVNVQNCINQLVERHESLRTTFLWKDENPYQKIHDTISSKIKITHVVSSTEFKAISENFAQPFDLLNGPCFRVELAVSENEEALLMFDLHHIITDGMSMQLIMQEFLTLFKGNQLASKELDYKDFAVWQSDISGSDILKGQQSYWVDQLGTDLPILDLPTDLNRPPIQRFKGGYVLLNIPSELTQRINELAKSNGTTVYTVLLSTFKILLAKYARQEDIVIGTPSAGRPTTDLQNLVGMFINTLALRSFPTAEKTFNSYLKEVANVVLEGLENQHFQFEDIIEMLDNQSDPSRNPIFSAMFTMQNFEKVSESVDALQFSSFSQRSNIAKFDITLSARELNEGIALSFNYATSLFKASTIQRLSSHFITILDQVTQLPNRALKDLKLISEPEQNQILTDFNDTSASFPKQATLHSLFEKQVTLLPQANALWFQEEHLSYSALNANANQVARHLLENGLKTEDVVALQLTPSFEMLVSILGVLKAGGTYLPIDSEAPSDRLRFILSDSNAKFILYNGRFSHPNLVTDLKAIDVSDKNVFENQSTENLEKIINPDNTAYIIYTSGSTGKPKGCLISHQNVVRLIHNDKQDFDFNEQDVWILAHAYYFDFSVWEMYGALLNGGKLIIPSREEVLAIDGLLNLVSAQKVTVLNQTPIAFNFLMEAELQNQTHSLDTHLRYVIFGGDKLELQKLIPWVEIYPLDQIQMINMYGITETTVHVSYYEITNQDLQHIGVSPIGRPIAETTIHVLDDALQMVPINMIGELFIGGTGVGKGYLNQSELTQERFIESPFVPGERLYKSGDLARWNEHGILEYIGRKDFQMKIRGFRIEAGEIEHALHGLKEIKEAVVVAKKDNQGVDFLCAYIILAQDDWSEQDVKNQLSKSLASYMVPDRFVVLDTFPLSATGKLNRKALPDPSFDLDDASQRILPRNKTEEQLALIWEDILGIENISVASNFFQLGGHSLKGASLVARVQKTFDTDIKLKTLFEYPTIRSFAEQIQTAGTVGFESIPILKKQTYYAVSPAQKRLWLVDQIQESSIEYNMVFQSHFHESIDLAAFKKAIHFLLMRHETLRTTFTAMDGVPVQIIHDEPLTQLEVCDLTSSSKETQSSDAARIYEEMGTTAFNLEEGPLVKAVLIKKETDSWQLIFSLHHIITDGWSLEIVRSELIEIYQAYKKGEDPTLQKLPIQYKDYAAWQNSQLTDPNFEQHRTYWHHTLKGNLSELRLPYDFENGVPDEINKNQGASHRFYMNEAQLKKLKSIGATSNASLFMLLLTGFNIVLHKLSDSNNILIGTPAAGRSHEDLKLMNGFFLNTLILRNEINSTDSFKDILQKVQQNVLQSLDHQSYPFEELVDELNVPRNPDSFPITSVFFNMLNFGSSEQVESAVFKEGHTKLKQVVKFDLNVYATEYQNGIQFNCVYKQGLFLPKTIETIFQKYIDLIDLSVEQVTTPVSNLIAGKQLFQSNLAFKNDWFQSKSYNSIVDRFEEIVRSYPENDAVWSTERSYSYNELSIASDQLAHLIRDQVSETSPSTIAICTDHSEYMVLAVLAVLKAGHIYVPLDASYPKERLNHILEETNPVLLLTIDSFSNLLAKELINNAPMIVLNKDHWNPKTKDNFAPSHSITGENTAYILYTSGSTGKPKGVLQSHKGVLHFSSNYGAALDIQPNDKLTGFSSINFDSFVNDLFGALLHGACYLPISLKKGWEIDSLVNTLNAEKVTIWHSVPSVFRLFAKQLQSSLLKLDSLRIIKMTGEPTSRHDFNLFHSIAPAFCDFVVSYGSTESTLNTIHVVPNNSNVFTNLVTPGQLVPRTEMVILNATNEAVGIMEAGEICVHSPFITPGYHSNAELNEKAFFTIQDKRFYKTGDVGYFSSDESLHIVGRKDHQVKIRGIRVEPGEIEHALRQFEDLEETIIIAHLDDEDQHTIAAYFTVSKPIDLTVLKEFTKQQLAEHLVPTYFIELESFQLTPNGKVDRGQLPIPTDLHLVRSLEYVPPTSKLEEDILEIWTEVLQIDPSNALKVGILDNFFDLGGHSLKAIAFTARFASQFEIQIPLRIFFDGPTVKALSHYVESNAGKSNTYDAIVPAPIQDFYPLSSSQKRLYILNQLEQESTNYNMPSIMHVYGTIDLARFEKAFHLLIKRHESLRTNFRMEGDELVQIIHPANPFELTIESIEKDQLSTIIQSFVQPFNLETDPLFKVRLIHVSDSVAKNKPHHVLLIDIHHIVSDGQSLQVIKQDFIQLYNASHPEGSELIELASLPIQFKDYAVWQNRLNASEAGHTLKQFWLDQLMEPIPALELPYDFPRPELQSFNGKQIRMELGTKLTASVRGLAQNEHCTLFMVLLTSFKTLLHHYSGNKDVTVGSPISGRSDAHLEGLIGMFVNTLVLRSKPTGSHTFASYLQEVKKVSIDAFDHQLFSFEEILDELEAERDLSRNPLFDTMFVLQDQAKNNVSLDSDLIFENYKQDIKTSKFDLSLIAYQSDQNIQLVFEYCSDLFQSSTVQNMLESLVQIIEQASKTPNTLLSKFEILNPKEKELLLNRGKARDFDFGIKQTLDAQIIEVSIKFPEYTALVFQGNSMPFAQLNKNVSYWSDAIEKRNIRNARIGIRLPKSSDLICVILAIWRTGNSYVPIDPEAPDRRLEFIIQDANLKAIFTDSDSILPDSHKSKIEEISIQISSNEIDSVKQVSPSQSSLDSEAYVIYTSGSTGTPKGVSISHRALADKMAAEIDLYQWNKELTTLFSTNYTFDASILELFPPLLLGGKLVIPSSGKLLDFKHIYELIDSEKVSVLQGTPSFFKTFTQSIEQLDKSNHAIQHFCIGGESLTSELVELIRNAFPGAQINNHYGPTEVTVDALAKQNIKVFTKNCIGKPLINTPVYILSEDGNLVPDGVIGEIYVGGNSLATEYLNQAELTSKAFISDPFIPNSKMYKTGDLGRWTKEQEIEFLGRNDHQFKIRGYRVELGEIESSIESHPLILQTVVHVIQNNAGDNELLAYYIPSQKEEGTINSNLLRTFLTEQLPSYMIPSYFVEMESFALTAGGKIDKKLLPLPSEADLDTGVEYIAAEGILQEQLVEIWQTVLKKDRISIKDNFFELGGHSLKATQVVSRIQHQLSYDLNLKAFFTHPTIESLTQYLQKQSYGSFNGIKHLDSNQEYFELSNSQRRLWIIDQLGGNRSVYNMTAAHVLEGTLHLQAFKSAFKTITERHEILRTVFLNIDGDPKQQIISPENFVFHVGLEDYSSFEESEKEENIRLRALEDSSIEFDLSKGPLLRATLFKLEENKHVFLFNIHHIISDGWSMEILMNEVIAIYKSNVLDVAHSLRELPFQYKEFAAWQNQRILEKDEQYWLQQLSGDLNLIQLPTDFPKNDFNEGKGEQERIRIEPDIVDLLKIKAQEHQTTLSNVVFTVFNILLNQLSGQTDLVIGLTSANRTNREIEDMIGFFVNSLVIRTDLSGDLSFGDLLEQVKQTTSDAFEHQNYPFDLLVEKLSPERFTNHQPLVNVTYSFQNLNDLVLESQEASKSNVGSEWNSNSHRLKRSIFSFGEGNNTSKFDLLLFVNDINGTLDLNFEYNSALFKRTTIQKYLQYFNRFLTMVTQPES